MLPRVFLRGKPPLLADGDRLDLLFESGQLFGAGIKPLVGGQDRRGHAEQLAVRVEGFGQEVVIPARLRKEFQIQAGSKAVVQATPDGILLRPVTGRTIAKLHGILKRKPGDKPFAEEWAEHKREEIELEDRRHGHDSS